MRSGEKRGGESGVVWYDIIIEVYIKGVVDIVSEAGGKDEVIHIHLPPPKRRSRQ